MMKGINFALLLLVQLIAPTWALAQSGGATIVVGTPVSLDTGPLYVIAAAKGFDVAEGIKMDVKIFPSGAAMVEALAAGSVQVGTAGDIPFLSLVAAGVKAKLIAQNDDSSRFVEFYAREDVNIRRPEDLYGKTIGHVSGSTTSVFMNRLLEEYGLDTKKIRQVNLSPGDIIQAYQRGDIDAFICWPPFSWQASQVRPSIFLHDPIESYFPEQKGPRKLFGAHTVIFAREDLLKQNPASVVALIRALKRALAYINDSKNMAEVTDIYADRTKISKDLVARGFTQKSFTWQLQIDETFVRDLEFIAEFYTREGRFKSRPDVRAAIDVTPLRAAAPELVRWNP